jgi:hypothetical protein
MRTVYLVDDPLKYFCTQSFEMKEWAEQYETKLAAINERTEALKRLEEEVVAEIMKTTKWLQDYGSNVR